MNKIFLGLVLVGYVSVLFAQHQDAGTTEYSELNNSYDAQSISMAGAAVAVPNGLYGVFSNPATLGADIKKSELYLGYNLIFDGIWGGPIAYARSFAKYGVFAVDVFSTNTKITETTTGPSGEYMETGNRAQYTFLTGGVSWGYEISEKLFVGASLKGIYKRIVEFSSDGIGVDLGMQYRLNSNRLVCGVVVRNLGFMINGYTKGGDTYDYPLTVEGGISFIPRNIPQLRLAFDLNKKLGDYLNFEPGLELNVYKKFLSLRLGYAFSQKDAANVLKALNGKDDPDYTKSNWAALCVGAGLKTVIRESDVKIDFGLQFHTIILSPSFVISALVEI